MTDQEIIDIAKKHMEYSVMYGFVGEPATEAVIDFARAILAAQQEPTSRERSIVLDLVRCGLGHKPLLPAFVHQVHRLAVALPTDEAEKVRRNLQWHEDGRKKIDR